MPAGNVLLSAGELIAGASGRPVATVAVFVGVGVDVMVWIIAEVLVGVGVRVLVAVLV